MRENLRYKRSDLVIRITNSDQRSVHIRDVFEQFTTILVRFCKPDA